MRLPMRSNSATLGYRMLNECPTNAEGSAPKISHTRWLQATMVRLLETTMPTGACSKASR
ncbi:hypothetical protein D3C86_871560 [compost metagenome]